MKEQLRTLLERRQFGEIAEMAARKKRILNALVSLTFDRDLLIAWRAVEAMGVAADRIAENNSEYVLGHLRQLYWLISEESGGVCWYAPQAMAEIVRRRPQMFSEYIPIVISLLDTMAEEDLEHFRAGILWAIARLAPVAAEEVESVIPSVVACLDRADPQVRGMAAWCLEQAGKRDLLKERADLLCDNGSVEFYNNGMLTHTSVNALIRDASSTDS